jgi:cell division protein FtsQ
MAFGSGQNRRRGDAVQRTAEVKSTVRKHGPSVLRALLATVVTAGLLYGGFRTWTWARSSPFFALEKTAFHGLHRATEAELVKLSGLTLGQNLWTLDTSAFERSMAAHPWIRKVKVARRFPRGLSVQVEEHVPAAMVMLGDLYLLSREGVPFKRLQPGDAVDLPLISGFDRDAYVAQQETTEARLREALAVVAAYAESPAARGAPLSELRLGDGGMVLVVGKAGQEVFLGEGDVAGKLARLTQVKAALAQRQLSADVIHLENRARPGWVAVKLSAPVSERSAGPTK